MRKKIDLDIAREFLNEPPLPPIPDKKALNATKKQLKELRERYPIQISVSFKIPWWADFQRSD